MITPTSREEWEALDAGGLDGFSDLQLKKGLQEYFGLKSHVYFMPVSTKKQFILNPADRPTIQAEAEARQKEHQTKGAAHKGKKPIGELIAERATSLYEFVGVDRPEGGFTDPFSDRAGKVAYIIKDTEDGSEFPTQKQTCKKLTELNLLAGFDERIAAVKQKPAHRAGFQTLEDAIATGDTEVQAAAAEIEKPVAEVVTDAGPDEQALPADREKALDDILNSLEQ